MTNAYKQSQPTHTLSLFENMRMPTLQSKFCLLNSIPNHHKWNWTPSLKASKQQLKFEMRFTSSNRYYPGSTRNLFINAIACPREVSKTLILTTLHSYLGILNKIPPLLLDETSKNWQYQQRNITVLLLMKKTFLIFLE